jgi:hypothetical protein
LHTVKKDIYKIKKITLAVAAKIQGIMLGSCKEMKNTGNWIGQRVGCKIFKIENFK